MRLKNKVALITGASRGVGRAVAEVFAAEGADVVINYVNSPSDLVEEFASQLAEKYGVKALAIKADVADDEQVRAMREVVEREFGRLDILVNNAGIVIDKPYLEHTKDDYRKIFDTNVYGVMNMTRNFGDLIATSSDTASIINMSSTSGMYDFWPDNIDYAGSKLAIQSITHDLAIQYGPKVRVNAIALGWADTDMNKDLPADDIKESVEGFILKRMARPEEVAKPILFLASDDASFVNGTVLVVDGGRF